MEVLVKFLISLILVFFVIETFLSSKKMSKSITFTISVAIVVSLVFILTTQLKINEFAFNLNIDNIENNECEYIEKFLVNKLNDDSVVDVQNVVVEIDDNNNYKVIVYLKDKSAEKEKYVIELVEGMMHSSVEVYEN